MQAGLPLRPPQIAPACPSNRLGEGSGLPLYISDWTRRWPARCLRLVKTYGAVQLWLWMGHIAQLRSSLLTQPLLSKLSASAPLPILFASCRQFPPLHPTLTLPAPFFLAECTGSSAGWVSRRHAPWASPHQPSADPRHLPTRARAPLLKLLPWPPRFYEASDSRQLIDCRKEWLASRTEFDLLSHCWE